MLQCGLPNDSKYGYYWSGISYVPDAPVDAQTMNTGKIIGQRDKTTKVNWATLSFGLNQVSNSSVIKRLLNMTQKSGFKPTLRLTLVQLGLKLSFRGNN